MDLKNTLQNYKNILNGKIIIENFSRTHINSLKGYIKLKNDPKIERFDINNVVLSESVIRKNEWVLGLVLFLGNESLISKNIHTPPRKKNYFSNFIELFLVIALIQTFILSIVIINYFKHF